MSAIGLSRTKSLGTCGSSWIRYAWRSASPSGAGSYLAVSALRSFLERLGRTTTRRRRHSSWPTLRANVRLRCHTICRCRNVSVNFLPTFGVSTRAERLYSRRQVERGASIPPRCRASLRKFGSPGKTLAAVRPRTSRAATFGEALRRVCKRWEFPEKFERSCFLTAARAVCSKSTMSATISFPRSVLPWIFSRPTCSRRSNRITSRNNVPATGRSVRVPMNSATLLERPRPCNFAA